MEERDFWDEEKPLVAISSDKNRKPMSSEDVRKSVSKLLGYLDYRFDEVLNGDAGFLLASYAGSLDNASLRKVASIAASLYYSDMDL